MIALSIAGVPSPPFPIFTIKCPAAKLFLPKTKNLRTLKYGGFLFPAYIIQTSLGLMTFALLLASEDVST